MSEEKERTELVTFPEAITIVGVAWAIAWVLVATLIP